MKLVALFSGGSWQDASASHIIIPDDMNLDEQKDAHNKWLKEVYRPALIEKGFRSNVKYISFKEWLIKNGAVKATNDDIIEYWN